MDTNKLNGLLKVPLNVELEDHLKTLMEVVDSKRREEVCSALARLDGFVPKGNMDEGRNRKASLVHVNSEWTEFVLDAMDSVRNKALLDGDSEFLKGQLVALDRAYRHFEACFNRSNKPQS